MKKRTIFTALILIAFILAMAAYNSKTTSTRRKKEAFTDGTKQVLVLGDSSLNNEQYVPYRDAIPSLLKADLAPPQYNVIMAAQDKARIKHVYQQLQKQKGKPDPSIIILSVGGNDILENSSAGIKNIFDEYNRLKEHIKAQYPSLEKLIILDVYLPMSSEYSNYVPAIKEWNMMLSSHSNDEHLLKLSELVGAAEDFVDDIEPSISGGKIISDAIVQRVQTQTK
jgi:lysophospholipase L1-like esterase